MPEPVCAPQAQECSCFQGETDDDAATSRARRWSCWLGRRVDRGQGVVQRVRQTHGRISPSATSTHPEPGCNLCFTFGHGYRAMQRDEAQMALM